MSYLVAAAQLGHASDQCAGRQRVTKYLASSAMYGAERESESLKGASTNWQLAFECLGVTLQSPTT